MVTDEPMLAICLDQSKACDSVRPDLLEFLLAGSGLPRAVWRPIMDMAKAPRRLKVMTAVGGVAYAHLRLDPRLPSGHSDHEPAAGDVEAWLHHALPDGLGPVLGG